MLSSLRYGNGLTHSNSKHGPGPEQRGCCSPEHKGEILMKTEAASLKWSELDSACISTPANPRQKIFQITYAHSFPCCPIKEHTVPLSQPTPEHHPRHARARFKALGPRAIQGRKFPGERKDCGAFPLPHFSERMCLFFMWQREISGCDSSSPLDLMQQKEMGIFPLQLQMLETRHCLLGHLMDTLHTPYSVSLSQIRRKL